MKSIGITIMAMLSISSIASADSEQLECDSTQTPDQWTNVGGTDKVASVSDALDRNYIEEETQGDIQRFSLENPQSIAADDIIDSVVVHSRMRSPGFGMVIARINVFVATRANGTNTTLNSIWTDHQEPFNNNPDDESWTLSDIDNLQIEAETVSVPALEKAQCTRLYAVIFFRPQMPAPVKRINQQYMLLGE